MLDKILPLYSCLKLLDKENTSSLHFLVISDSSLLLMHFHILFMWHVIYSSSFWGTFLWAYLGFSVITFVQDFYCTCSFLFWYLSLQFSCVYKLYIFWYSSFLHNLNLAFFLCISYRRVPSTIWPIFPEFLIFCRLDFRTFTQVK